MIAMSNGMKCWECEIYMFVAYACYGVGGVEPECIGAATSYGGAQDLIRRWSRGRGRMGHVVYFRIAVDEGDGARVCSG